MNKLFYHSPASIWEEGLPIGNGKLGAMIYGDPLNYTLQCNEDSIWQGDFNDRNPKISKDTLNTIQSLIFKGKTIEAQEMMKRHLTAIPEYQRQYEPAGDLHLSFDQSASVSDFYRELDLSTALYKESYQIDEANIIVESFSSYPNNIIGWKLSSTTSLPYTFTVCLNRLRGNYQTFQDFSEDRQNKLVGISGQTANDGVHYAQCMNVESDGILAINGQYITVSGFKEITLYTTASTTFREENPVKYCLNKLKEVRKNSWDELKQDHLIDYQKLFNQLSFTISAPSEIKAVPDLLNEIGQGKTNNYLTELMFQYGRYLLISSSRPGSLPANLQGIWNKDLVPAWDSKFTININTEMNYWPAEKTGLSECHLPLFDHIKRMYPNGVKTAKSVYGIEGFTAHHNTYIWGDTAPQDAYLPATYWPMGALWLSLHIWEHYDYTLDKGFLEDHFYLLEESLRFILHYLVESPEGYLVTNPSVSPENSFYTNTGKIGYVSYGTTMDNQLIWEIIQCYLKAVKLTAHDKKLVEKAFKTLEKLPPHQVGNKGQLMEWIQDYSEEEPGHRHFSHLFGIFPGHKLKHESESVIDAARRSLELRLENGGGHTGWSAAWLINLWAHFKNNHQFHEAILKQLNESTLPNLLDNHPPFQIDGNFGFTSGVIEGLVQYDNDRLDLFPALPKKWTKGEIKGIHLPNRVQVDISWNNHVLENITFKGTLPGNPKLYIKNEYYGQLNALSEKDDRFLILT
ncbi:glycoside hydrolase family 95 protein [Alkalibacterium olivapovliticus]|uniref:Alpha-L-fucosidase 2 n=1 Tax=Alkalibacterium olivapovliticus TaxID=99907 RepID=A0A2T0W6C2_9LACT|nr:glycoside hydrolase family 95 protein [Alkalibacterium olivapovliticus]PRY82242.1 alpha-L-fucosidase 2 [Alkalibacterium olivapovliticus]